MRCVQTLHNSAVPMTGSPKMSNFTIQPVAVDLWSGSETRALISRPLTIYFPRITSLDYLVDCLSVFNMFRAGSANPRMILAALVFSPNPFMFAVADCTRELCPCARCSLDAKLYLFSMGPCRNLSEREESPTRRHVQRATLGINILRGLFSR